MNESKKINEILDSINPVENDKINEQAWNIKTIDELGNMKKIANHVIDVVFSNAKTLPPITNKNVGGDWEDPARYAIKSNIDFFLCLIDWMKTFNK
jgi:hypothetical protein